MSSFVCPACGGDVAIDETPSAAGRTCLRCGRVVSILGGANGDASSPATLIAARGAADRPAESPIVLAERPVDEATRLTGTRLSHDLDGPTFLGRASSPSEADVSQMLRSFGPAPASSAMGQIGPYRIQSVLGVGGMGAVFRAEDETLQRPVALKAMLPSLAAHHSAKDRFLREARSVAALKHPHVITVYTVGETQGLPYLAMEFLEGESLDVRLKREGRLPVSEVLRIGREAALGLAAAHEKGLVHRDVKPANLFLEAPRGQVKVLDFGLARTLADDDRLTSEGMVVGTLAYMAPEQAAGETVDARSDVFSLGCVLYTMCTGDSPFRGQNSLAILSALAMHRPKSPRELNADVPPRLGDLILRMLSKKPEQRPESAARVAAELHAIEAALAPAGASSGERNLTNVPFNATRAILIAGAVMALIEAVVAGVIFWPTPHGTVRIETDDPAVEVVFDKDGATIKGAEKEPIKLRPGKHAVLIKRRDFEFEAENLTLKSGDAVTLKLELLKGNLAIVQDGKVIASQAMPSPSAAPPVATSLPSATPAATPIATPSVAPSPVDPLADWLKEVAPLPPEERLAAVLAKLKECNPGFDGRAVQQRIDGGVVEFEITTDQVTDVSPIRALPELQKLALRGSNWSAGALADLAPLRSLRIVDLDVFSNKIVDLSPVASLPLRRLNCAGNPVTSLEPLRGMKLRDLDAQQCPELKSIAPLAGMPLAALNLSATKVSDIAPLRGMTTLTDLAFTLSPVRDATPLRGLPLTRLSTLNSQVTDLSPLRDVPLTWLHCDFVPERDAALLRSMKLLETINEKPAAEFWKEVDGGK